MPLSLVGQLTGAVAIGLWSKMRAWALIERKEHSREHFLEWFQWLVEQLERRGRKSEPPAYTQHHNWQPPAE